MLRGDCKKVSRSVYAALSACAYRLLKRPSHSKWDYRDESLTIQLLALRAGGKLHTRVCDRNKERRTRQRTMMINDEPGKPLAVTRPNMYSRTSLVNILGLHRTMSICQFYLSFAKSVFSLVRRRDAARLRRHAFRLRTVNYVATRAR